MPSDGPVALRPSSIMPIDGWRRLRRCRRSLSRKPCAGCPIATWESNFVSLSLGPF